MNREAWDARQAKKAEIADHNREARDNRSPQEQLELLDQRLGKDQGAKKERARLIALIQED